MKLVINKYIIIFLSLVVFVGVGILLCSCVQNNKIVSNQFPNTVAENAKIDPKYSESSNKLTEIFIEEFNKISNVPRPSGHVEKVREYLLNWGKEHNLKTFADESGNVIMDISATPGYENKPAIILQGHMDMVAVGNDPGFDPLNTPIKPIYNEEAGTITTDGTTSLGADDAEGICTMMAIARSNVAHGPLRYIFTYDEETTTEGAKGVSADTLNADYMINIDNSSVGTICISAAGCVQGYFKKNYTCQTTTTDCLTIDLSNLKGGHSGVDITQGRYNANKLVGQALNELTNSNIDYAIVKAAGGEASNSIANACNIKIGIDPNKIGEAKDTLQKFFEQEKNNNKCDNEFSANIDVSKEAVPAMSSQDSKEICEILNWLPFGVLEYVEGTDSPLWSCNVGILSIENGAFWVDYMYRTNQSSYIETSKKQMEDYAAKMNATNEIYCIDSVWERAKDQRFTDFALKAFKEACNIEACTVDVHAGLESSAFADKKPNLKIISIGADVVNEHNVDETLYTKSLPTQFAMLLYMLENIS